MRPAAVVDLQLLLTILNPYVTSDEEACLRRLALAHTAARSLLAAGGARTCLR